MIRLWQDLRASGRAMTGFIAVGFGWAAHWAQMPAIKAQIGASDALFGTLSLIGASGAILAMVMAPLVQRWLGMNAMLISLVVMAAGFVLAGLAEDPVFYTIAFFMAAGGSGVADVLANAEVSVRESRVGRSLMNLNHGIFSVSYAVAAVAVGWARGAEWTPVMVYLAMAFAILLMTPWMRLLVEDETPAPGQSKARLPQGLVILGGFVVLSAFLGEAASEGWSALHVERTLGGTPEQGAYGPAILATGMAIGRLGGHVLTGHLPPIRVMIVASCLAGLGLAMAGAAQSLMLAYAGFALGGLGASVVGPLALGLVGQAVPSGLRLRAISQAAGMGYGAFFIGPILMGYISHFFGLRVSFYTMACLMFIVAAVLLPMLARQIQR